MECPKLDIDDESWWETPGWRSAQTKDLGAAQKLQRKPLQQATLFITQEKAKAPYRHGKHKLHKGRSQCTLLPALSQHSQ